VVLKPHEGYTAMSYEVIRDKNGNTIGRLQQNGDRINLQDKNGNNRGYFQERSNGTTEFRDKNGNLRSTTER
jgi:hypothetical protein